MGHYVYKYVVADEIIYIGKNDTDLKSRIYQHSLEDKFKPFLDTAKIYYTELANKVESDAVESLLINKYSPRLNVAKMCEGFSFDFNEPKWVEFVPTDATNDVAKPKKPIKIKTWKLNSFALHFSAEMFRHLEKGDMFYQSQFEHPYEKYAIFNDRGDPSNNFFGVDVVKSNVPRHRKWHCFSLWNEVRWDERKIFVTINDTTRLYPFDEIVFHFGRDLVDFYNKGSHFSFPLYDTDTNYFYNHFNRVGVEGFEKLFAPQDV